MNWFSNVMGGGQQTNTPAPNNTNPNPQPNNGNPPQNAVPNNPPQNNNGNNNPFGVEDIWNLETQNEDTPPNTTNTPNNPPANPQNNNQPRSGADDLRNRLNEAGLQLNLDEHTLEQIFENKDAKTLNEHVTDLIQRTYFQSIKDMNVVMNARIDKAVKDAVTAATGSYKRDKFVDAMNEAIPFTKNPNVAPIAQSIANQFLKMGKSDAEAIEGTKNFFKSLNQASAKDLGLINTPPRGSFGSGNFNNNTELNNIEDWVQYLTDAGDEN